MKKNVSIPYETSGKTDVDIFGLMDEYLTDDDLLRYTKSRGMEMEVSNIILTNDFEKIRIRFSEALPKDNERIEQLIQEIITWPEFISTLLDMHFRGVIDINALHQEAQRNGVK